MKKNIHPKSHTVDIQCRCGANFSVLSTNPNIATRSEKCAKCFSTETTYKSSQEGSARQRLFENFSVSQLSDNPS